MKPLVFLVAMLGGIGGLTWGLTYHQLIFSSVFNPKFEDVRRETFEHSKSFKTGAIQELQNMQFEYMKADEQHKAALAAIILHRSAEISEESLPSDLRSFISNLPR